MNVCVCVSCVSVYVVCMNVCKRLCASLLAVLHSVCVDLCLVSLCVMYVFVCECECVGLTQCPGADNKSVVQTAPHRPPPCFSGGRVCMYAILPPDFVAQNVTVKGVSSKVRRGYIHTRTHTHTAKNTEHTHSHTHIHTQHNAHGIAGRVLCVA